MNDSDINKRQKQAPPKTGITQGEGDSRYNIYLFEILA